MVTDRFADRPEPAQAELLFADASFDSESEFLDDFYNEILHQDTCNELAASRLRRGLRPQGCSGLDGPGFLGGGLGSRPPAEVT
ncbi:hypothetical protein [Streptomyces goshikiensis]|uniref:hypothetical protein n=1 Tax=Streptomyces goshikiensis TaxID=1942 RepID=UPI003678C6FC